MNILIFGASGRTGRALVAQALAQGHRVAAFVRTPAKLGIVHASLDTVQGDATRYRDVEDAVRGKDAVLSALGAASPFRYDRGVVDGIGNIVRAMEKTGVARLVYMSAINVAESRKHAGPIIRLVAPILLRSETAGHEAREAIIRRSSLDWVVVRAGGLTSRGHTATYRSGEKISARGMAAAISRADVADFMLRQLTDTTYLRKSPTVMY